MGSAPGSRWTSRTPCTASRLPGSSAGSLGRSPSPAGLEDALAHLQQQARAALAPDGVSRRVSTRTSSAVTCRPRPGRPRPGQGRGRTMPSGTDRASSRRGPASAAGKPTTSTRSPGTRGSSGGLDDRGARLVTQVEGLTRLVVKDDTADTDAAAPLASCRPRSTSRMALAGSSNGVGGAGPPRSGRPAGHEHRGASTNCPCQSKRVPQTPRTRRRESTTGITAASPNRRARRPAPGVPRRTG